MIKRYTMGILAWATLFVGPLSAHPVGQPNFGFVCQLGAKAVRISTEENEIVYRYGNTNGKPELTIRGSAQNKNLFFLHDTARRSEAQQIRFVNGDYSYALSSLFVAAAGGEDWVKFYILRGKKVLKVQLCRNAASFEDFDQLDRLPRDTEISILE